MYMASMSRIVCRRSSMRSMSAGVRTSPHQGSGSRVLVMLRLRMSSSLTTLLISFCVSSSRMSIFHCSRGSAEYACGRACSYVAAGSLLDSIEDDWAVSAAVSRPKLWAAPYGRAECLSWKPCWRGMAAAMPPQEEGSRECGSRFVSGYRQYVS